jgi:hypothetical protein
MNYFAHGLPHVEDPYVLAGTAVPDWLNVADRGVRVRTRHAAPFVDHAEEPLARIARGIVEHHRDDAWFHETPAFHELCWQFTSLVKQQLPDDEGFRPSFLGHILVEILLDAELIRRQPSRLEQYYRALESIDGLLVQDAVNRMAVRSTDRLAPLVPLFCRERFLWDYLDDGKLLVRLNQVMRRVRLPALPEALLEVLPQARAAVQARASELLASPHAEQHL